MCNSACRRGSESRAYEITHKSANRPHDLDVKALLRLAVVWNIPVANNRATADFLFGSPLMDVEYARAVPDDARYERERAAGR